MTTLIVGFALGMRHEIDPDHLTAIDGLNRLRPWAANAAEIRDAILAFLRPVFGKPSPVS